MMRFREAEDQVLLSLNFSYGGTCIFMFVAASPVQSALHTISFSSRTWPGPKYDAVVAHMLVATWWSEAKI